MTNCPGLKYSWEKPARDKIIQQVTKVNLSMDDGFGFDTTSLRYTDW